MSIMNAQKREYRLLSNNTFDKNSMILIETQQNKLRRHSQTSDERLASVFNSVNSSIINWY